MPIVFAAAASHAPGITAWNAAATESQRTNIAAGFGALKDALDAARPEVLIVFTSEHWTNFFLDNIGAYCVGRGESFSGPTEPWLNIAPRTIAGAPELAGQIVERAYDADIEVGFSYECELDHGTVLPLHFLDPNAALPIVPVWINTLAPPQPHARRAFALGKTIGALARSAPQRIGLLATGGMSHDPGEVRHGIIDDAFDRRFLEQMRSAGNNALLTAYTNADFAAAGAGAFELLAWIALRGALGAEPGTVLAYEAVKPWATGIGLMSFAVAA